MSIENPEQLEGLRRVGRLVARVVDEMFGALEPGMTTRELDAVGRRLLEGAGARSAPRLCYGFPGWTMISLDEEVAHAVPSDRVIRPGSLVNIDVSAELDGFFADTGESRPVGPATPRVRDLCRAGRRALGAALREVRHGQPIAGVAHTVRRVARRAGFRVIENLAGHGVGRHLHEEPADVPRWWDRHDERRFERGTVLTIEPFLSTGARQAETGPDGWALRTAPGHRSVQFEHTVVVTDGAPIVLTGR